MFNIRKIFQTHDETPPSVNTASSNTDTAAATQAAATTDGFANNLHRGFDYLQKIIVLRLETHFAPTVGQEKQVPPPPPYNSDEASAFTDFLKQRSPSDEQHIALLMGLVPHVYPNFFDALLQRHLPKGMTDFIEFGGIRGTQHRGILPTGETLLFILAGNDYEARLDLIKRLRYDSFFNNERIMTLESPKRGEPTLSGQLVLDPEIAEYILTDNLALPKLSIDFPAEHVYTELSWDDLVLDRRTHIQIQEIQNWLVHSQTLLYEWGMHRAIKPGYRALFYGPPGTGKTLTASLLGKTARHPDGRIGMDVFRIDLSMVVSKYIGETEKNLSGLFDRAENKNWILFFDEADALFGKRTGIRDAHDKYANQEVAYLLQRIENYAGLVILATNSRSNIDEAFMRRFQSAVYFPLPEAQERLALWQKALPPQVTLGEGVDLQQIAQQYDLSGANIINIIHYCCVEMLAKGNHTLTAMLLREGIVKEKMKEDKFVR
jgi:AAA+ superfamily predicted ATPase